jgi:hypothetical protein
MNFDKTCAVRFAREIENTAAREIMSYQFSNALPVWRWEERCLSRFLAHHDMLVAVGALAVPPSASCHQPLRVKSRFTPHPGGVRVPKDVKRAALRQIDASFECGSLEKAVEMAGFSESKNSSR